VTIVATPAAPDPFPGTHWTAAQILRALARVELRSFRPVGSTSTVFRTTTGAPLRLAFKTATHRRPLAAVAEVAAYRIARCLGMTTVPPALLRRVDVELLQRELEAPFVGLWPSLFERMLVEHDTVEGAAIYWIEGLRDLALDPADVRALRQAAPSDHLPPMAAALSDLFAFDYLIGNWDRWSGGNVKGDPSGQILYVRDHDAAFAVRIGDVQQRRLLDRVIATERFSRRFVEHLRALTPSAFEQELAQDPGFAARRRLGERNMDALFDRRAALLSHVQALIDEYGEQRVLAFP
jgi:hypothetical protein